MIHNFKSWQGWLLFGASMAVVFWTCRVCVVRAQGRSGKHI